MAKPDLKLIDENYQGSDQRLINAASLMKEGRRRAVSELGKAITEGTQAALAPVKQAHKEELDRLARTIGKAQHREGVLQGIVLGMAAAIGLALVTFMILKDVVILNTGTQRVNYPNPPAIEDQYDGAVTYERNPREPQDARQ